jgi:two-component system, NtrC family, sensor kinase
MFACGDPRLLRVALRDLLHNAWKFSAASTRAFVEVGTQRGAQEDMVFFVRDNGSGFDMAHAGRLFGVFERLHSAQEFPGTGIGLARVSRVVARHGGHVWAESRPGEGAAFYLSLPAAHA